MTRVSFVIEVEPLFIHMYIQLKNGCPLRDFDVFIIFQSSSVLPLHDVTTNHPLPPLRTRIYHPSRPLTTVVRGSVSWPESWRAARSSEQYFSLGFILTICLWSYQPDNMWYTSLVSPAGEYVMLFERLASTTGLLPTLLQRSRLVPIPSANGSTDVQIFITLILIKWKLNQNICVFLYLWFEQTLTRNSPLGKCVHPYVFDSDAHRLQYSCGPFY